MNYVTNYYKNLSEQLQEKVNVLQYKVKQLNEMVAPPGGFDDADSIYRAIEKLIKGLTKSGSKKVHLPQFIHEFGKYRTQLRALGRGTGEFPVEFYRMLLHGDVFVNFQGRLLNISRDGRFLIERLPNGEYVIVKNIADSPWGSWEDGVSTIYRSADRPIRPISGGGWGEFGPAAVAPFLLARDDGPFGDDDGFRVDQEPGSATPTPTPPQSPAGTPVRHWTQDWHP